MKFVEPARTRICLMQLGPSLWSYAFGLIMHELVDARLEIKSSAHVKPPLSEYAVWWVLSGNTSIALGINKLFEDGVFRSICDRVQF
jgi:hypothetical protein